MRRAVMALAFGAAIALPAAAQAQSAFTQQQLSALRFEQHPGGALPLDAALRDEAGEDVRLGDFFHGRPVLLVLDYLHCKTLCGFVLDGLAANLGHVPLDAGRDFEVVAVSIDPTETAADGRAARARYLAVYGRPADEAGWHFLTGTEASVRRIADAVGFHYRFDEDAGQYAHPAGIVVAASDGRIARYLLGIDYKPLDLRLGLTEAARGAISSPVSDLLLLCYCYDPATGRYSASIDDAMRVAGLLTVLGLLVMMTRLGRAKRGQS